MMDDRKHDNIPWILLGLGVVLCLFTFFSPYLIELFIQAIVAFKSGVIL